MSARTSLSRAVTRVMGVPLVEHAAVATSAGRLRVLAFHGVPDAAAFTRLVRHLRRHYQVVSGAQVADSLSTGVALPRRAAWLTFDDGEPSVVHAGLPVLEAARMPATLFVCPSLIEAGAAPWWRLVEVAGERGHGVELGGRHLEGAELLAALKLVPDPERRQAIESLVAADPAASAPPEPLAVSPHDLRRWLDAGMELGNHTWDHPCLDRCDPGEQADQLRRAHEWLADLLGRHPRLFAYPNGDHTPEAEAALAALGYEVGLLFDHRLASIEQPSLRLSRLRIESDAPLWRARAVLSGLHGALLGVLP